MRRRRGGAVIGWLLLLTACGPGGRGTSDVVIHMLPDPIPVDPFDTTESWSAYAGDGVALRLASDEGWKGRALRMDFGFQGGGYAVAHRAVDLELSANYSFRFRIRGKAPVNHLEFKLIDASGENVWWHVFRDVSFPEEWETFRVRKRQIQFAWGPLGGGEPTRVAAIEFAITAGSGGEGSVWIDELELVHETPRGEGAVEPGIRASSSRPHHPAKLALDGDPATAWRPKPHDRSPWIELDFGYDPPGFGGLLLEWAEDGFASSYTVDVSDSGDRWATVRSVTGGNGGRDFLFLPQCEARFVRISRMGGNRGAGPTLASLSPLPLSWSATRNDFLTLLARDSFRGAFPRGVLGEPTTWTVVGPDGSPREGLLGGDGALEIGKQEFSIEPFLRVDGRLITWADVRPEVSLQERRLPIPSVMWEADPLRLTVTASAVEPPASEALLARYQVRNTGHAPVAVTLYLAARPFQVNPPSQQLNTRGGGAPIRSLEIDGAVMTVNGSRIVRSLTPPDASGAATFDGGDLVAEFLAHGRLPARKRVEDPFEAASGAFAYALELGPGAERTVDLVVPYPAGADASAADGFEEPGAADREFGRAGDRWNDRLDRVGIRLPDSASHALQSLQSQVGFILVNRAGPAIQPGPRAYARSWIRDGALTSSALLRMGHEDAVRDFIEWFAPHQYASGKIPCVVDHRGADPVPEHDSTGEFLFLLAEYFRYTGERGLAERYWPQVVRAVAYLDSLRNERRTPEYAKPGNARFYGILPPSISHEGYSAKPMHSYWDDFFALRGFKDAVYLAGKLGHAEEAARFADIRDEFQRDLAASIEAAMEHHGIDYIPGCADLGDFDATSTTVALSPAGADFLSRAALEATFERYYGFFRERREGAPWEAFTPYEIRNIGAFVRLGWRDRAQELLDYFLAHQNPPGWNQWAEVVWHDTSTARFIGDLPHTWVGSDYVRSFLDLLAYEREADSSLVLFAGVPRPWIDQAPGVVVEDLRTPYGRLSCSLRGRGNGIEAVVEGALRPPPGGLVLRPPLDGSKWRVEVNGLEGTLTPTGEVIVHRLPARVVWEGPRGER